MGASKDILTNKKVRSNAHRIASQMKIEGRFDSPALRGIKPHIPDKMPGLMELPGRSAAAVKYLSSARNNPAFKSELKAILGDAKRRAAA